ncbi:MAG TPA: FAD-binding oxidoreductase [Saprospiraceae bacterium]|nr:FAD-binding oxidoreductase [Saprospiraceae bacterium]
MPTHVEYLIIGQGIAGTMVAHSLEKVGKNFLILEDGHTNSSSMVAAGTINPVTGRKYVKTWLADTILPCADQTYTDLNRDLGESIHRKLPIIRSLHNIGEENAWLGRANDPAYSAYISSKADPGKITEQVNMPFAFGEITGSSQVDLKKLIDTFKAHWIARGFYRSIIFDHQNIQIFNGGSSFQYEDIHTENLIFCEGHQVVKNPFFNYLDFDPVKGEALIIHIPNGFEKSLRDKTFITPLTTKDQYWCGSGYEKNFTDKNPSTTGRLQISAQINEILKVPYEIVDQVAGIRPSTKKRRPYIGRHPNYQNMFIFNGLGTKGSSLSPYFAQEFVGWLLGKNALHPEVSL